MKKTFFLLAFIIISSLTSIAQTTIQGSVDIQNHTDCDIYWDVTAICPGPPCKEYSTGAMNLLTAHTSTGNMAAATNFPWATPPGAPTCQNWTWAFADIVFTGNDQECGITETGRVGTFNCNGGTLNSQISFSCTCNGQIVYVDFIPYYSAGCSCWCLIIDIHY